MTVITEMRRAVVGMLAVGALAIAPSGAAASEAAEEKQGADLLSAVERGETGCAELATRDFMAIGEFVMGRMLGSPEAHEAMDSMMASMMGGGGLDRMHEVMGVRFSGCGNPSVPGGFGGIMGAMGMMSGGFGPGGGMMGGGGFGPGADYGPGAPGQGPRFGAMMGSNRDGGGDDDDIWAWIAIAMLVLIVVAGAVALTRPRWQNRGAGTLDLLAERFARGEISAEEYAERRRLVEEGAR